MVLRFTWKTCLAAVIVTVLCVTGGLSQRPHPIRDALYLGNHSLSDEREGNDPSCIWRRGADRDACPDPDISYTLYGPDDPDKKQKVDLESSDWLRGTNWDSTLETILLIHGYAGGDDTLPIIVLRDAYLRTGKYNVVMVDWGALCPAPCYVAAVHNLRSVARCTGAMLGRLLAQGLPVGSLSCVGHSLGAHVCGIMANYLPFRITRIIGLDPARPLVRNSPAMRLDAGDAHHVQVLHTNAGHYGEGGRLGHMDVCINGGRSQPYCSKTPNEPLCSHIWSICYQAESLFTPQMAEPCARRCPMGALPRAPSPGVPLMIGQPAPQSAFGTYCLHKDTAPFCPSIENNGIGDERCCLTTDMNVGSIKNRTHYPNSPQLPPPPPRLPVRLMKQFRRRRTFDGRP